MKLLLAIGGAVAAAGVFLLATASAETALLATHYPLLLLLNARSRWPKCHPDPEQPVQPALRPEHDP